MANFRLALNAKGELLTHHLGGGGGGGDGSVMRALTVTGQGVTVLDGATCGELKMLAILSVGRRRRWLLNFVVVALL